MGAARLENQTSKIDKVLPINALGSGVEFEPTTFGL